MSDDENFLARWARRKRDAVRETRDEPKPETTESGRAPEAATASPPPVDPASLPPIESIGPGSDIRAFLAAGVPAELTQAALRRAWSADPTIRNFVGLSENSWDFNAPGVPGFGSVTAEDVRRLLGQAIGEPNAESPPRARDEPPSTGARAASEHSADPIAHIAKADEPAPNADADRTDADVATQHRSGGQPGCPSSPRRGHGGALPQ